MKKEFTLPYFLCSILFVTCLLLSNIAASKMFVVGPLVLTAGSILFPITYIVNDVLAEIYGYQKAQLTILIGFAMNVLMVVYFSITILLPYPSYYGNQSAYQLILGNTPRLLVASLCAYLIGTTLNARIMVSMRDRSDGGKGLFFRCITSTLFGELSDSIIFVSIAFSGVIPSKSMIIMMISQAGFKTLYEILIFPVTNFVIAKIKRIERLS